MVWSISAKGAPAEPARQITCTGKVIDAAGGSVADAKVRLHKLTVNSEAFTYDMALVQELTTKDDGVFTLKTEASKDDLSGQAVILAEKDGLALGWANWRLNENIDVEIKLDRPQIMAGKVLDDAGKPISGAEVSIAFMLVMHEGQPQYLVGAQSLEPLTTRTDAQGRFSFGRIAPDASAEFVVNKPSKATVSTFNPENFRGQALQFSSGQTDIWITLGPEARIEGTVVDKATGRPAAGIRIMATRGRNQPNFGLTPSVSGEDGKFTIDSLVDGTHTLRIVTAAGKEAEWIAEPVEVVTEAGKTKSGVKLQLSRGGLLEVVITDAATGKSVEQARVSIRQEAGDEYFSAVSDANGIAGVRLMPGEYQMTSVQRDGYSRVSEAETITIADGTTTRIERQLTGQPRLSGVVRDEEGNPVRGAKLKICPMGTGQDVTSDAEGKFEVSWDPGRWRSSETPAMVLVARYERGDLAATADVDEDTRTRDIVLRAAFAMTGRVIDPDGKPIANAQLTVMLRGPRWGSSIGRSQPTTNEEGRFEITALPTDNSYTIYTRAEGYGQNRTEEINADDAVDNRLDIGDVTLAVADLSVSGVVVDNDDKPVAGASVSCYGDNQANARTQTGTDGRFTLDGICAGTVRVSVSKSGAVRLYGSVETEGGATDVKIVVSERSSSTRYVPKRPPSLLRKPLPELKDLNIDLPAADTAGKMILVCFLDVEQRPSRNCLRQLGEKTQQLKAEGVVVAAVQASKIDLGTLDQWRERYNVSFPLAMNPGDEEKTRFAWGVRALPWLILTDTRQIVVAAGFGLEEINDELRRMVDK
jgi:protocatechuate 3,4-dioxygenase beta subunit